MFTWQDTTKKVKVVGYASHVIRVTTLQTKELSMQLIACVSMMLNVAPCVDEGKKTPKL